MNWLDEPEPQAAPADVASPESLGFDEEPFSAEPLGELGMAEEPVAAESLPAADDEITLPVADAEADALDWLAEPALARRMRKSNRWATSNLGKKNLAKKQSPPSQWSTTPSRRHSHRLLRPRQRRMTIS